MRSRQSEAIAMSKRAPIASTWKRSYCAPVVAVVSTAEAENLCLQHGLLLHELLSPFGVFENVNCQIRSGGQILNIPDVQIRFERATEMQLKQTANVEQCLRSNFRESEECRKHFGTMSKVNHDGTDQTPWDEIIMRSMAFTEFEMISHPIIILSVVSTSDVDPIACMQELVSVHHMPQCLVNGQYEADVQHVFAILHDTSKSAEAAYMVGTDPNLLARRMQSLYPAVRTRLLVLNPLLDATAAANSDSGRKLWGNGRLPLFFPEHVPAATPLSNNSSGGGSQASTSSESSVNWSGSRLSPEDIVNLRDFCLAMLKQDIMPALEARLATLTRQVTDVRKGVKNVLKSFWRKPREDLPQSSGGSVRYRCDRIETQTLLLADYSFIVEDYENALSLYRMVKDDYKADKSYVHLAHVLLMSAACLSYLEPSKREWSAQLESLVHLISTAGTEMVPFHCNAYFALLGSEIIISSSAGVGGGAQRAYLEASNLLLVAAATLTKFSLINALLVERAAAFFAAAGYPRKCVLYQMIAGVQYQVCSSASSRMQALLCFVSAANLVQGNSWGAMKLRLLRAAAAVVKDILDQDLVEIVAGDTLATDTKQQLSQRLLMLRLLFLSTACSGDQVLGRDMAHDLLQCFREILSSDSVTAFIASAVIVSPGWESGSVSGTLTRQLPITVDRGAGMMSKGVLIYGLPLLQFMRGRCGILQAVNGRNQVLLVDEFYRLASPRLLRGKLAAEVAWAASLCSNRDGEDGVVECGVGGGGGGLLSSEAYERELSGLLKDFVEVEIQSANVDKLGAAQSSIYPYVLSVHLGEYLMVSLAIRNPLPEAVELTSLELAIEPIDGFESQSLASTHVGSTVKLTASSVTVVELKLRPTKMGLFRCTHVLWKVGSFFSVRQPLPPFSSSPLSSRKSIASVNARPSSEAEDVLGFSVRVLPEYPLLSLALEGVPQEILQGQLVEATLLITNEGSAPACDIMLKLNQPSVVFSRDDCDDLVAAWGQTFTVVKLSSDQRQQSDEGAAFASSVDTTIADGSSMKLKAWVRIAATGPQEIQILASYRRKRAAGGDGEICSDIPNEDEPRTSFLVVKTRVFPFMGVAANIVPQLASVTDHVLLLETFNRLTPPTDQSVADQTSITRSDADAAYTRFMGMDELTANGSGAFRIRGVQLLGAAVAGKLPPMPNEHTRRDVHPGERSVLNILLSSTLPYAPEQTSQASSAPSPAAGEAWVAGFEGDFGPSSQPSTDKGTGTLPSRILERFLCAACANSSLNSRLEQVRSKALSPSFKSSPGPRSISQLRRDLERREKGNANSTSSSVLSPLGDDKNPREQAAGVSSLELSGVPLTYSHVAAAERHRSCVTLSIVWTCVWRGRLRVGVNYLTNLSVLDIDTRRAVLKTLSLLPASALAVSSQQPQSQPSLLNFVPTRPSRLLKPPVSALTSYMTSSSKSSSGGGNSDSSRGGGDANTERQATHKALLSVPPSHLVLASVSHCSSATLSLGEGIGGYHCVSSSVLLPVTLHLRSLCPSSLSVDVHARDRRSAAVTSLSASSFTATATASSSSGETDEGREVGAAVLSQVEPRALRWEGKTKYLRRVLAPYGSETIVFYARISLRGVFDLNRFDIAVNYTDGSGNSGGVSELTLPGTSKLLKGQSLVEVQ